MNNNRNGIIYYCGTVKLLLGNILSYLLRKPLLIFGRWRLGSAGPLRRNTCLAKKLRSKKAETNKKEGKKTFGHIEVETESKDKTIGNKPLSAK
jgi:hypothetical protein